MSMDGLCVLQLTEQFCHAIFALLRKWEVGNMKVMFIACITADRLLSACKAFLITPRDRLQIHLFLCSNMLHILLLNRFLSFGEFCDGKG